MNLKVRLPVLFIFLLLALSAQAQVAINKAVNFTVVDTKGNEHRLFEYLDDEKYVLLDFSFPNCGPCNEVVPAINDAFERYGCNASEIVFIGMTRAHSDAQINQRISNYNIAYPMVNTGMVNQIAKDYGVISFPTVVLIAPNRNFISNDIYPVSAKNLKKAIHYKAGIDTDYGACAMDTYHPNIRLNATMNLFPNPITSGANIQINISKAMDIQVRILNLLGQKIDTPIDEYMTKSTNHFFEFKELRPGLYLIQLVADGSIVSTHRFSKITP